MSSGTTTRLALALLGAAPAAGQAAAGPRNPRCDSVAAALRRQFRPDTCSR